MLHVYFCFYRRMKWRNSKERELLASGGSREQTLPNKNNPHPDLSDAILSGDKQKMELCDFSPSSLSYTNNNDDNSTHKMDVSPACSPSRSSSALLVDYSPSSNTPSRDDDDEISVT